MEDEIHYSFKYERPTLPILVCLGCHDGNHRLGGLNPEIYFLTVVDTRNPRPSCQYGRFRIKALFLA